MPFFTTLLLLLEQPGLCLWLNVALQGGLSALVVLSRPEVVREVQGTVCVPGQQGVQVPAALPGVDAVP